ncbi:extracellular solute-binding protein [Paenibacillus mendelii]|uniref:Extracellular solute-binding protein n=1 Tax=Paenibacillus mendelii TaxID=206163 RepID=A0ABV6J7U7_9BACL|nr:extracellular solute-binding protein [Paenibacillus mendelii]MCQ6561436.1 extracellular solute-binding protein [Paenibacillus mendelii]
MKKASLILLAVALFLVGVIGCGNQADDGEKQTNEPAGQSSTVKDDMSEKLDITMMVSTAAGGGWSDDHPMVKLLNEKFNINLKFQWVPGDSYNEKLNVLAASNNFPDLFQIWDASMYSKWMNKGVFLDLQPLLKDYPNIVGNVTDEALRMMNPKDKVYGLPMYAPAFRSNLSIRKDWLDKLNLTMPTTVDEFYNVAKAFAEQDPDGNGKKDTIGFSLSVGTNQIVGIDYLKGAFGLANNWALVDGKLVPQQVQAAEWKALAEFLRKAYAEGVLDKDFAVNKDRDPWNKLEANTNGIAEVNPNEVYKQSLPTLQKLAPSADIVQLDPPKGPTGLQFANTITSTTKIVLNGKLEEKKQQRVLKVLDYIFSDEGFILTKNGIEGIHYQKDGDKYVKLDAFDADRPQILSTWFIRRFDPGIQIRLWDDKAYSDKVMAWFSNTEKYRWTDPAAGLVSETTSKLGAQIDQKLVAAIVKVIVGSEPVDSIDKAIEAWKAAGGDKIIEETNAIYAELN